MGDYSGLKSNLRRALMWVLALSAACLVVLFFFRNEIFRNAAKSLVGMLQPFLYGGVIAYLLRPVCGFTEKILTKIVSKISKKDRRGPIRMVSILLSVSFMLLLLVLLIAAVIPELINSVSSIISNLPGQAQKLEAWVKSLQLGETGEELIGNLEEALNKVTEYTETFLSDTLLPGLQKMLPEITSSVGAFFGFVKNFGLGLIVSAYLMGGWEKFMSQGHLVLYGILPEKAADWVRKEAAFTNEMFSGFISGKLIDSLIIGLICFIFCTVAGMPYAMLVSVIIGVTNLIPFFGPWIGAVPTTILILTVNPVKGLIFLVFIIVLQQVDGNVLGPAILGDRMGISSFWILFSILFFGSMWGIVGMLIGVPLFSVLYDIFRSVIFYSLTEKGMKEKVVRYRQEYPVPEKDGKGKK